MDRTDAGVSTPQSKRFARVARRLLSRRFLLFFLISGTIAWVLWARCGVRGCPPVERLVAYAPDGGPVLLDRAGEPFARLAPVERRMVPLEALPEYVPAAFVAVEDRRFHTHGGIDWIRVAGALVANVRAGRTVQGSSTITMQLARNVFPERLPARERTWRRKLLEARVARRIEKRFTKDEILELYLNHIYFGRGAYGIEAASRHYFGKGAADLTVDQAALLAALPKAPSTYDPRHHPERARSRRDIVLSLMADQGLLGEEAAREAQERRVRVAQATDPRRAGVSRAPWFVHRVRELLEEEFGEDLWTRRLVVHTTLDPAIQQAFEEELEAQARRVEAGAFGRFTGARRSSQADGATYLQGAAAALDARTGEVRALVGGRDWTDSRFDRAVDARRQVGSAFKPFVFATALAEGWSARDWLEDAPYRLASSGGRVWTPSNFDGRFYGPVTVREALVLSRNVPSIRLAEEVGVRDVARVARAAGLSGAMPESPVIALGVTESSPLELAAAYGIFANEGLSLSPRLIDRVETADGEKVWEPESARIRKVLDEEVAAAMTELLRDAVDRGTGRAVRSAGYRGPAAGKTGTTNEGADAWFVGYTPSLIAAVWIGFDEPRPIAPNVSGGTVAAETWGRALRRIGGGSTGWPPLRIAGAENDGRADRRDHDDDDDDDDRRVERRAPRRGVAAWLAELERNLQRELRGRLERQQRSIEREREDALRELADGLGELTEELGVDGDARRELRRFLGELGREIERGERERMRERERALEDWLEAVASAVIVDLLEDAELSGEARERIAQELRRGRAGR